MKKSMTIRNVIRLEYGDGWNGYPAVYDTPHHVLLFVDSGYCVYWIDGERHVVEKGDVLFIPEGSPRRAEPLRNAHSKYSVHFTGDGLFRYFPDLAKGSALFKSSSIFAYLNQRYIQMHREWTSKEAYCVPWCEGVLLEVVARIHKERMTRSGSGKQSRMVQQVRDYILQYYREPLCIEELAQLAGRNPSHLITSFKKYYGMAPIEYMHHLRISKAEELLLTTESGIAAIAEELGYCDAAYFNRMFKKLTGRTPSAYRARR